MKKWLWIPILLIVLFAGDRIAGLILSKTLDKSDFRYTKLYDSNQGPVDYLLVGNSRGLMFYQPEIEAISGKTTLNVSYNGLPIQAAEVLVQDYLEKHDAPVNILLDVTCADRENVALVSGFNAYSKYSPRLQNLIKENSDNSYYGAKLSHLFRYNSEIFQRALRYLSGSDKYWLNDRVMSEYTQKQALKDRPLDFTFSAETYTAEELIAKITSLVDFVKKKNANITLLINPYYPPYIKRAQDFDNWKESVSKATGLKVHDYSTALDDPKYFTDFQHCNVQGSKAFIKMLNEDGILK